MSILANFEAAFQKDEKWVINEFTRGWQLFETVGHTASIDILGISKWIEAHQGAIVAIMKEALQAMAILGALVPGAEPTIAAATIAIDAATAALDKLSKTVVSGSTPLGVAVSAFHATTDAATAVKQVVKLATTKPAPGAVAAAVAAAKK